MRENDQYAGHDAHEKEVSLYDIEREFDAFQSKVGRQLKKVGVGPDVSSVHPKWTTKRDHYSCDLKELKSITFSVTFTRTPKE